MSGRTETTRRSAQVLLAILVALPMTAGDGVCVERH
jgi:hypothetical protein